ncbi:MAG: exodeoxyribonuclease VII large subunit, partial [Nitrospiraceae bacterium]
ITLVKEALAVLPQLIKRLEQNVRARVALRRQHFRARLSALHNLSPLSILSRGYSILQIIPTGHVVRRSQDVSVGENVRAQLSAGHLICSVRHVSHDS